MLRYVIGDDYFFKIIDEFLHSKKQSPNNQVPQVILLILLIKL